jgi:hypothetical protein
LTRISSRYALVILLLLLVVTPFALLNTFDLYWVDDCPASDLLAPDPTDWRSLSPDEAATAARFSHDSPAEGRVHFLSYSSTKGRWAEGRIPLPETSASLDFVLMRSYYPRRLYLRPVHFLAGTNADRTYVEWIPDDSGRRIPIQRGDFPVGQRQELAAWLLVFAGKPVENPYLAQLLEAPRQLFFGRSPMTMFFVSGTVPARRVAEAEDLARRWLLESWGRYQQACERGSGSGPAR